MNGSVRFGMNVGLFLYRDYFMASVNSLYIGSMSFGPTGNSDSSSHA